MLLRALLLQILYSVRSERMLMEQLDYNPLFRWFVGLNLDAEIWVPTTFARNRDRLLKEARLACSANVLMENRHGLIVDTEVTQATSTAEIESALAMLAR